MVLLLLVPLLGLGSTTAVSGELAAVRVTKRREIVVLLRFGTWQAALRHVLAGKVYVVSMLLGGARGVQGCLGLVERTDGLDDNKKMFRRNHEASRRSLVAVAGLTLSVDTLNTSTAERPHKYR